MKKLGLTVQTAEAKPATSSSCCPSAPAAASKPAGAWVTGTVETPAGRVPAVSTEITQTERREHLWCRVSAYREAYTVQPGLYAAGSPDKDADVLVSANYKLSFDALRKELKGLDVWILVLDTKGINVWCAAGKGTFGTDELVNRISLTRLKEIVDHKRLIVPQLGAVGISAHNVKAATGFKVKYGPVRASDIPGYIHAGHKATREMRTVRFGVMDRLILTPMELNPAMKKYPPFALFVLLVFGLQPTGIIFKDALTGGLPFLLLGFVTVFTGAFLTPVLLPYVPFRSFAVKGWIVGMLATVLCMGLFGSQGTALTVFTYLFFPMASSYIALQFTGSTTFTGMTGVEKELRVGLPVYLVSAVVSVICLIVYKINEWGVL